MRRWKFPRVGSSWSSCQTCDQEFPSTVVQLNPRFGWQCPDCWDGLVQRDQILQPIFPYEGTRRASSPLTNTLTEGIDSEDNYTIYTLYDRADHSITYDLSFGAFIEFTTPSTSNFTPVGALLLNNGWFIYISNGYMSPGNFPLGTDSTVPWAGSGDWQVTVDGFLEYTPYDQQLVAV